MLNDYAQWLKEEGKSENTIRVYTKALQKFITWYENTEGLSFEPEKVTVCQIHEFQIYMEKIEKLEPPTINKIIASLKNYYKYTENKGFITCNPMIQIKMKRTVTQYAAPKWLTQQELQMFYDAIEKTPNNALKIKDLAICHLMSGAGLRVKEVVDLNMADICIENHQGNVSLRCSKNKKIRTIPLYCDVVLSVEAWLGCRGTVNADEPLFIGERSNRLSTRSIHSMVAKYVKKADLNDVSPYTLRHTFCKTLIEQGVVLERVAYLAGHENLETTRRYIQPSTHDFKRAIETM